MIILSLAIISFAFVLFVKWRYNYWNRKKVPFLPPRIIFGNVQNPLTRNISTAQEYRQFYNEIKAKSWKHGGVFSFLNPVYVPTDLDYIKNILAKDFNYFDERGRYYNEKVDPISAHLFNLGGEKWRELRKKFTPTFSGAKLKSMFEKVLHCRQEVETVLAKKFTSGEPLEIQKISKNFTAEIIGLTVFGVNLNTLQGEDSEFLLQTGKFLRGNLAEAARMVLTFSFPEFAKLLGVPRYDREASAFFSKFVAELVEYREKSGVAQNDFLQTLIDLKNLGNEGISMEQLTAQAMIFLVAGYDSTAATIALSLFELSVNLEIQEKVREEIRKVVSDSGGELTYEGVLELKYTQQVISEALRKYPPLAILNRQTNSAYKIRDSDVVLDKGTPVIIPLLGLHYDEEHFPNPEKFDPERFSQENIGAIKPYSYLPFGEGPKGCLGTRFGLLNAKVGLCALLKDYRYTLNTRTEYPFKHQMGILNSVKGGIWLNIEKVD